MGIELRKTTTGWLNNAQDSASELYGSASSTLSSVSSSISSTLNSVELPDTPQFLKDLYSQPSRKPAGKGKSSERNDEGPAGGKGDRSPEEAAAVAALVAATMSAPSDSQDERQKESSASSNGVENSNLMHLTKKLIEIRSVLLSIDQSDSLKLPSIVVIGSQSSGKSSVLEAIVGHQFLPKYAFW